jgi:hypothetical protein
MSDLDKIFYAYVDYTTNLPGGLDAQKPIYWGKGVYDRSHEDFERNSFHAELVKLYGQDRRVILCSKDEWFIFEYEVLMIAEDKTFFYEPDPITGWRGANKTRGGEGASGYIFTELQRLWLSVAQSYRFEDPAEHLKLSESQKERFKDPAERAKISVSSKRVFADPSFREWFGTLIRERFEDPYERLKLSVGQTLYWEKHPEQREVKRQATIQMFADPEFKAFFSSLISKRYEDPEARRVMSKAQLRPEVIEKKRFWFEMLPDDLKEDLISRQQKGRDLAYEERLNLPIDVRIARAYEKRERKLAELTSEEIEALHNKYVETSRLALSKEEVRERQRKAAKKRWSKDEEREKQRQRTLLYNQKPGVKEKRTEAAKQMWNDPQQKATLIASLQDPEVKEKQSAALIESAKIRWENPEEHTKTSLGQKKRFEDENQREIQRQGVLNKSEEEKDDIRLKKQATRKAKKSAGIDMGLGIRTSPKYQAFVARSKGKPRKCSNCGQLGHKATTCKNPTLV